MPDDRSSCRLDAKNWTASWQHPTITTFGTIMANGYDGPFLDFWRQQVRSPVRHVLDLACGNGALSWLFNDLLNSESPVTKITGVDFADIAPFRTLGRAAHDYPAIEFIGNTALENLPFDDHSFDLAASQFGIEYSDLTRSIAEVARVLKPDGRVAFVLHDRDGWLVTNAIRPLADYKMILNEVPAAEIILELGSLLRSGNPQPGDPALAKPYRRLLDRLDATTQVFAALYQRNPDINPVLAYKEKLNRAFAEAHKPEAEREFQLREFLRDARESLRQNIARIEDLAAIALDDAGRQQLCALLEKHGFRITTNEPIRYTDGQVWGSVLAGQRQ